MLTGFFLSFALLMLGVGGGVSGAGADVTYFLVGTYNLLSVTSAELGGPGLGLGGPVQK